MKKINVQELIETLHAARHDAQQFQKTMDKAAANVLQVATANLSVPEAQRVLREASLTNTLVEKRLAASGEAIEQAETELTAYLRQRADQWDAELIARREALESQLVRATAFAWEGDEVSARRWFERGNFVQMPVFAPIREAFYGSEVVNAHLRQSRWPAEKAAEHFIRHVERHAGTAGIKGFEV